eukprot:2511258-Alexandrium_andersonii.AAC.1
MECYHPWHRQTGQRCRRTTVFTPGLPPDGPDSESSALRRLKWWALAGVLVADRNGHQALPRAPADSPLPSEA